MNYKEARY